MKALAGITKPRKLPSVLLPDTGRVALLDGYGKIVAVNKPWLDLAEQTGASVKRVGPGANYLEVCRRAKNSSSDARGALKGIQGVLQEKLQTFTMDYAAPLSTGPSHFRMTVMPIPYGEARVAVTHIDVTDLHLSRDKHTKRLQQFAHRLMRTHEEERERISREIHDDLSNRIALLASLVRGIKSRPGRRSGLTKDELAEVIDSITDLSSALRDLSHGLHPPVLKYAGICAALKALCEEFGKTHGVHMDVVVPDEQPRLPEEVELCLFRISQESLTNVAKHSGADAVSVVLETTANQARLKIIDTGRGFVHSDAVQKGGLGLISMEERVLSLLGNLEVNSAPGAGAEIEITIPIDNSKPGEPRK